MVKTKPDENRDGGFKRSLKRDQPLAQIQAAAKWAGWSQSFGVLLMSKFALKACTGRAFPLEKGAKLRIVNTFGNQVVDVWAFIAVDIAEFMSMEHTRVHAPSPTPVKGTTFLSNTRRPMLEFTDDTSPGVHDWFFAACDQARYEMLGCKVRHENCSDNLRSAMAEVGHRISHIPCPLNIFENAPLLSGDTGIYPPVSCPGDFVELTALADLILCLSACPQDMADTNGTDRIPKDVEVQIHPAAEADESPDAAKEPLRDF
jgi:uncharacterized protein